MIKVLDKRRRFGRLEVHIEWRSGKSGTGRFGGGWQWKLGFQAGGTTLILNLLILMVSFTWMTDAMEKERARLRVRG